MSNKHVQKQQTTVFRLSFFPTLTSTRSTQGRVVPSQKAAFPRGVPQSARFYGQCDCGGGSSDGR